jgi:hypothetical protein
MSVMPLDDQNTIINKLAAIKEANSKLYEFAHADKQSAQATLYV